MPDGDLVVPAPSQVDRLRLLAPIWRERLWNVLTILFFGITALIFIEFAPFTGATVGAVDITTLQTSPYVEDRDLFEHGRNTLQTDQTDTIPLAASFWEGIKNGELRIWEPDLGTGMPLGGAVYTRVWSPIFWPGVIVSGAQLSSYGVWLALWLAQLGAWALARRLGIGRVGATLAGVAYGFSGPVTALLLRIHETTFAPWVFLAVHCLVARRSGRLLRYTAALALAVAVTWLGGFPAGSMFVLYGAGAIAVGTALVLGKRDFNTISRNLVPPFLGIALGTMLVAPLLLPSYEFLTASESLERTFTSAHSAGLPLFGSSVSGRIFGTYQGATWWWPVRGYSNPVEASITMGMVVLVLLFLGAVASRCRPSSEATQLIGRVYLPIGLVVFVGTFLGGPLLGALQTLPFIGSNSFGRSRFLLSLVVALAAGNVLDGLVTRRHGVPRPDRLFRLQCLAVVLLALVSVILVMDRAGEEGFTELVLDSLIIPLACGAVALGIVLVARRSRSPGRPTFESAGLGLVVLLLVELQWGSWGFTPVVPPEEGFYPEHPSFEVMRPDVADGNWRFAGTDLMVVRPNSAGWLDLSDLRASNPTYEGYRDLMRAIDPEVFERARLRTWFTEDLDPASPGLDRSAVRFLMAAGNAGVLEASSDEEVPVTGGSLIVPETANAARGLSIDLGVKPCSRGSLTVLDNGREIARQPLWLVEDQPMEVPLPDIEGAVRLDIETQGCAIELPSDVTILRAWSDSRLRSLWALGAVVYERLDARPRIEIADAIEGIADEGERLDRLVSSRDTDVLILEDDRPLTQLAGGVAQLMEDSGEKLTVDVESIGDGYLVVRDANAPGWRAFVDGEPTEILDADHAYRAVQVPEGRSIVTMIYAPHSRVVGFWVAAAAILVFFGLGVTRYLNGRRPSPPKVPSEGDVR
jgi:hypothetical protein